MTLAKPNSSIRFIRYMSEPLFFTAMKFTLQKPIGFVPLFLCFFLGSQYAHSQSALNKKYSKETFVYSLNAEQFIDIYNGISPDTVKAYGNLFKRFNSDSAIIYTKLPYGHYLEVKAVEANISYSLKSHDYFNIQTYGVMDETWIVLAGPNDDLIKNAEVSIDKKSYTYSADCGCYPVPAKKANGMLFVKTKEHYTYRNIQSVKPEIERYKNEYNNYSNYDYSRRILPGYIITSKPKYRLRDTVKIKTFLMDEFGKPWNYAVHFNLLDIKTNKTVYKSPVVKKASKGAFVHEFVLSDTLKIDQDYQLQVYNSSNDVLLKTMQFRLEDYELEASNVYLAFPLKEAFYKGEKVQFLFSGKDVNRLPLLDVKAKVKVQCTQFVTTNQDFLFVPHSWYLEMYATEVLLDASGEHLFTLPDSVLPEGDFVFKVDIEFTDHKQRTNQRSLIFRYHNTGESFDLTIRNDSIEVLHKTLGEITIGKKAVLEAYRNGKLLSQKELVLPAMVDINLAAMEYRLVINGNRVAQLSLPDKINQLLYLEGARTHDSITISTKNAIGIDFSYRIFKKKEQMAGGRGSSLDYVAFDKSLEAYHVIYSAVWHGDFYVWESSFQVEEKRLIVSLDQKEAVYPGETMDVEIQVKDYKNRPVKKVNLTAMAANLKFGNDITMPDLPYFGRLPNSLLTTFNSRNYVVTKTFKVAITEPFYQRLDLEKTPFYQLFFNPSGIGVFSEDSVAGMPQLKLYAHNNDNRQPVYAIFLNDEPFYVYNTMSTNTQVFKVKPGTYNLKFRTVAELIEIPDLKIKPGFQTNVAVNLNLLEQTKAVQITNLDSVPFILAERQKLESSYLLFRENSNHTIYLEQDSMVIPFNYQNQRFTYRDREEGQFQKMGPFKKGNIRVVNISTDTSYTFYFEPGYLYSLYRDTVSIVKPLLIPDVFANDYYSYARPNWDFNEQPNKIPVLKKVDKEAKIKKLIEEVSKKEIDINNPVRNKLLRTVYPSAYPKNSPAVLSVKNTTGIPIQWLLLRNEESAKSGIWINALPTNHRFAPGEYQLTAIFNDSTYISKLLCFEDSGNNYLSLQALQRKAYDEVLYDSTKESIIKLNRAPLTEFNHPPETVSTYSVSYVKNKKSDVRLSGYFLNSLKNPMNSVVLFLEKRGEFVAGAVTNADGYFEMTDVDPGVYQLKIRFNRFKAWVIQTIVIKANTDTRILVIEELKKERLEELDEITLVDDMLIEVGKTSDIETAEQITNLPIRGTNGIAAMTPGVQVYHDEIRVRGARSNESTVFIDGVKVRGDANLPRESIQQVEIISGGLPANYGSTGAGVVNMKSVNDYRPQELSQEYVTYMNEGDKDPALLDLKTGGNTNRIRKTFRDYGYWVPNLVTDKEGLARFTVTLPDNITRYKTIIPALSMKKQTGMATAYLQAYKPLSAVLASPYHLVDGDKITFEGTLINYLDESIPLRYLWQTPTDTIESKNLIVERQNNLEYDLIAKRGNTSVTFSLETEEGYVDGEERKIEVKPSAIITTTGRYLNQKADTTFNYVVPNQVDKVGYVFSNSTLDAYKRLLMRLKNYRYGCNEQTASKLKALVLEKKMTLLENKPFRNNPDIYQCISILEKNQNKDGSYGWWGPSSTDFFITSYVLEALNMAVAEGYRTKSHMKAAGFLAEHMEGLSTKQQLTALKSLSVIPYPFPYQEHLAKLDSLNLSTFQEFQIKAIQTNIGLDVNTDTIIEVAMSNKNGTFWGTKVFDVEVNQWRTSMLAYEILSKNKASDSLLSEVRRYFLRQDPGSANTLQQADMLDAFFNDLMKQHSFTKEVKGEVSVNGRKIQSYPTQVFFEKGDTITVSIKGKQISTFQYMEGMNENPESVDSIAKVYTYFELGKELSTLKWNQPVQMKVRVTVPKRMEYVLIEVPMPGGFGHNPSPVSGKHPNEIHREKFRDLTAIACRTLEPGTHIFVMDVIPRFKGEFTVLPTEVGPMYFNGLKSYSEKRTILVTE